MMYALPDKFDTARGGLGYSTMDTGDRFLVFTIEDDDWDLVKNGEIAGMIIPADVGQQHLDQVLKEIRDSGGVRFVVMPRSTEPIVSD